MSAGRPAVPTALRVIRGNPGKRSLPANEPRPKAAVPECPAWVSDDARIYWPQIGTQLAAMGVSTLADQVALGLLVDALGDYIRAKKVLGEEDATFTSEKGYVGVHPAVAMKANAWDRVLKVLKEFGLTPASRTKVQAIADGKKDEFEAFMEKKA